MIHTDLLPEQLPETLEEFLMMLHELITKNK